MASREEDIGSSALEGGQAAAQVPPRPDVRGQAGLEADDRDPGRRDHERAVRLAGLHLLAAKNGRQIDPVTTVDGWSPSSSRRAPRRCRRSRPASQIVRINGDRSSSWDEVVSRASSTAAATGSPDRARRRRPSSPSRSTRTRSRAGSRRPRRSSPSGRRWWARSCPAGRRTRAGIEPGDTISRSTASRSRSGTTCSRRCRRARARTVTLEPATRDGAPADRRRSSPSSTSVARRRRARRAGRADRCGGRAPTSAPSPSALRRGGGRGREGHGRRLHPDRPHGPGALQRPDLRAGGGRARS